jgi:hypothetical protein
MTRDLGTYSAHATTTTAVAYQLHLSRLADDILGCYRRWLGVGTIWQPGVCQCRCNSCAALTDSMDSRRRGRPGEEILQFRCRLKLMLCHGHHRRGREEDAAVLVLPHQVALIWLARQHDAPLIVGLDECGVQHLSNVSNVRPTDADSGVRPRPQEAMSAGR